MATVTVNISFEADLLADIDAEAGREKRSRSEWLREAARLYVERRRRWESVFRLGDETVKRQGLKEPDVAREIRAARRTRTRTS